MAKNQHLESPSNPKLQDFVSNYLKDESYQILPLAGDASSRKYYRVVCAGESWVLMEWEPFIDEKTFPFLSVQSHLAKHKIGVPEIMCIDAKAGLILLEDLGDLTLERKFWENQNQELALPFYQAAIDEIIKIHYPATRDREAVCSAFQIEFDTDKFLWELNYGRNHLFEGLAKLKITDATEKALQKEFIHLCERLHKEPKRISHRDYHSRNLMIKLGQVRVIDFQDARMGPIQYDLVSLVYDSYVKLRREIVEKILDYYLKEAENAGQEKIDFDHFHDIMEIQAIQRCFKACGSFASFFMLREDARYLHYIRPTLRRVVRILEKYPEYSTLHKIITDNKLHEREFEKLCEA